MTPEVQHIQLTPNDVMVWKGRLAFARRILLLNEDGVTCRDCIDSAVRIITGPVPGADLN